MAIMAKQCFENLFTLGGSSNADYILSGIEKRISEDMNKELTEHFTKEEIDSTVKNMGPTKALVGDDFSTLFFQKY